MRIYLLVVFLLVANSLAGQPGLFDSDAPLKMKVITNIAALQEDRGDSVSYHSAFINYIYPGTDSIVYFKTRIKARGNFRRKKFVCEFPPLRMNTKKAERAETLFEDHKKLKLVCHCQGDDLVLQEYLIYKVYEKLTPYALKVRLAEITYQDLGGEYPEETHWAFFIEDEEVMAKRFRGQEIKQDFNSVDSLDHQQITLLYTFQYMIGNTDWNPFNGKNLKYLQIPGHTLPIPVPYDFDWSKTVDAPYTGLDNDFERRKMRELCRTEEEYANLFQKYLDAQEPIEEMYKTFKPLPMAERRRVITYFREFYKTIQKENEVKSIFVEACN